MHDYKKYGLVPILTLLLFFFKIDADNIIHFQSILPSIQT